MSITEREQRNSCHSSSYSDFWFLERRRGKRAVDQNNNDFSKPRCLCFRESAQPVHLCLNIIIKHCKLFFWNARLLLSTLNVMNLIDLLSWTIPVPYAQLHCRPLQLIRNHSSLDDGHISNLYATSSRGSAFKSLWQPWLELTHHSGVRKPVLISISTLVCQTVH